MSSREQPADELTDEQIDEVAARFPFLEWVESESIRAFARAILAQEAKRREGNPS